MSPKPGAAGTAESCCAESIDKVESASAGRCLDTSFSIAGGGCRRGLFCGGAADAEETFDRARSLVPQTCGIQSLQYTAFLLPHSTNAVARSECPTTKRLPLPLAYSQRKISAKRGIMKSLEIPNR